MEFRVETDLLENWGSINDPPEYPDYDVGLKRYFIDDVQVTEDEYLKAIAKVKAQA